MSSQSSPDLHAQHDVKRRIMEAAAQLFADKGYDATSISDITEAADVGRALIYYYFKDKRDLYVSIIDDGGEYIIGVAEEAYAVEGTAFERLRHFIRRFRQLHIDRPNLSRIGMRADLEGSLAFHEHAKEHIMRISSLLEKVIEEGIEQGEIRNVNPNKAVHMLNGIVHSLIMMYLHGDADPDPEKDIDFGLGVLMNGIAK